MRRFLSFLSRADGTYHGRPNVAYNLLTMLFGCVGLVVGGEVGGSIVWALAGLTVGAGIVYGLATYGDRIRRRRTST